MGRWVFLALFVGLGCNTPEPKDTDDPPEQDDDDDEDSDPPLTVELVPVTSACAAGASQSGSGFTLHHCFAPADAAAVGPKTAEGLTWTGGPVPQNAE